MSGLALLCFLLLAPTSRAQTHAPAPSAPQPEIRAFWADAFNEGFKTREQVDALLRRLRAANCNAIFAQMRKGGDAYYLSRYDPWAADNPERFDALAYLIEKAHHGTPRIAVHAWLNTCAVGRTHGNPFHIAAAHPDWLSLSDKGETYDNEATKIDPGHPDAADWTFRVYLDVLRHYDVDGVHFDFVRYGSTDRKGNWGYNPVSVARFYARYPSAISKPSSPLENPVWDDPRWKQWRRDQVTALVRKVYAMAAAVRPQAAISAATITWGDGPQDIRYWNEKSAPMNRVFQDWRAWMQEGILDLNCLMSYYAERRYPEYFRRWTDWAKDHQYRRWAVPSSGIWLNSIPDSIRQIERIRKPSAKGHRPAGVLMYSYAGTNAGPDGRAQQYNEEFYNALSQPSVHAAPPPFAKPAPYPAMPWKEKPTFGHLYGFVLTADALNPVDGAKVIVTGRRVKRTQYSDGTGFYAFIDLPPGSYTLRVETRGFRPQTAKQRVRAGGVTTCNVFAGDAPTPFIPRLEDALSARTGTPVRLREALVIGGTDVFPGQLYVAARQAPGRVLRVRLAQRPTIPFQAGDVVALSGIMAEDGSERLLDKATARLVDMPILSLRPHATDGLKIASGPTADLKPLVQVTGRVVDAHQDRFMLEAGEAIEVLLTGRKDPGVESSELPLPAPPVGRFAQVTGILTLTPQPDGKMLIRLRPRTYEDIHLLPTPVAEYVRTGFQWLAPPLLAGYMLLAWQRRRSRS